MATPRLVHVLWWLLAATATSGCYSSGNGRSPPLQRTYFPVGVELSEPAPGEASRWLYVANSDFDLQFNAGTLQAFDLDSIRAEVPRAWETGDPCPAAHLADQDISASLITPGPCTYLDPTSAPPAGHGPYLAEVVSIGAFVTDITQARNPNGGARLFLPVRGDASLHWIDVAAPGSPTPGIECGQSGSTNVCDANHRRDAQPEADVNGLPQAVVPPEPYGVAVDTSGEAVVIAHQSTGQVSLFVNDWETGPNLQYVLSGLPFAATELVPVPTPAIAAPLRTSTPGCAVRAPGVAYQPGFLLTFQNVAQVRLIRYFDSCAANPNPATSGVSPRPSTPFIEGADSAFVTTNSLGTDSRGIAMDAEQRSACEVCCTSPGPHAGVCSDDPPDLCLTKCAAVPVDVYVGNRTPPSLVVGQLHTIRPEVAADATPEDVGNPGSELPTFFSTIAVAAGTSRVVVGKVIDTKGRLVKRVFVVCFDSREIFVYDPASQRLETTIRTGRGPQAIAIDTIAPGSGPDAEGHSFGYIAHFTDSYVGVVDLDQRHSTYGQLLLTVGQPVAPRASK